MRKGFLVILAILVIVLFFSFSVFLDIKKDVKDKVSVCFDGNRCISTEIAETDIEKQLGLMYREKLGKNEGMLFPYESEQIRAFWMKNMKISLDVIWLDKDKKIVYIHENVQPCKTDSCPMYSPDKKAMYVLEVNANFSKEQNIQVGDNVNFDL